MSASKRAVNRLRELYSSVYRRMPQNEARAADPFAGRGHFQGLEPLEPRLLLTGTTFVVDSLADTTAADGVVTLREAIEAANTDTAVGDAPAGNGHDTINFADSLAGQTIRLTNGRLSVDSEINIINGNEQPVTIDAEGTSSIFYIGVTGLANLENLRLVNGDAGPAWGGAIYNTGFALLQQCTIDGNAGSKGGGIANAGQLSLTGSTLSNNTATGTPAYLGDPVTGNGGGLFNDATGIAVIVNSTFSGNHAEYGGGILNDGQLSALHVTISNNTADHDGAGVDNYGILEAHNSIVAGNFMGTTPNDIHGDIHPDSSYDLVGVIDVPQGTPLLYEGLQFGTPGAPLDAMLGPLAENGGTTLTHALQSGSPAIDAGSNDQADGLDTDQRGAVFPRQVGGAVDVGAFEHDETQAATINGVVFNDRDGDGVQDSGETGMADVVVYLDANDNGSLDTGEESTLTGGDGSYSFTGLPAGAYVVREVVLGYEQTWPVSTTDGQVTETEPNDSRLDAQVLLASAFSLDPNGDITDATSLPHVTIAGGGDGTFDYYRFTIDDAGDRGMFDIDGADFDTQLFLFDDAGNQLAANDDSGLDPGSPSAFNSFIDYTFDAPGDYVIGVGRYNSWASGGEIKGNTPNGNYTLHVSVSLDVVLLAGAYRVPLASGQTLTGLDFGNHRVEALTPDLTIDSLIYTAGMYAPGASIEGTHTESNIGDVDVTGATLFDFEVRLSVDQTWGNGDDVVLTPMFTDDDGLAAGASHTGTDTVTIPVDTPEGQYYVALMIDSGDAVAESDESNNVWWSSTADVEVSAGDIQGHYTSNLYLTASGSPYRLIGDVTFADGALLVVDAGVQISAEGGASISAVIQSNGTAESKVLFTSAASSPAAGDWMGLWLKSGSSLTHTTVEYGTNNVYIDDQILYSEPGSNTTYRLDSVELRYASNHGLLRDGQFRSRSTTVEVRDSQIHHNGGSGIQINGQQYYVYTDMSLDVTNSSIEYNGGGGVAYSFRTYNGGDTQRLSVIHSTIRNNGDYGVIAFARNHTSGFGGWDHAEYQISHCEITNNSGGGIYVHQYGMYINALINQNNIVDNGGFAFFFDDQGTILSGHVDASNNWWGTATPGGSLFFVDDGPGYASVSLEPFLGAPVGVLDPALAEILAKGVAYYDGPDGDGSLDLDGSGSIDSAWQVGDPVVYDMTTLPYEIDRIFVDGGFFALGLISDLYGPMLLSRGTEPVFPFVDVFSDLSIEGVGYDQFAANWNSVLAWLTTDLDVIGQAVDFVGHSLGGALSQWFASAASTSGVQIDQVVTFNSPGISHSTSNAASMTLLTGYDQFNPNPGTQVTHYIASGDIVSLAGEGYLDGDHYQASWYRYEPTGLADPITVAGDVANILVAAHTAPLIAPRIVTPVGKIEERPAELADMANTDHWSHAMSTTGLGAGSFGYADDIEYQAVRLAINFALRGIDALPFVRLPQSVLAVPADMGQRSDVEANRKAMGQGLAEIADKAQLAIDEAGRVYTAVKDEIEDHRVHDLFELYYPSFSGSETLSAVGDPPMLVYGGDLGIAIGNDISIDLPLGLGTFEADHLMELVDVDVNGVMDGDHLLVHGDLDLLGGIVTVDGRTELDWSRGQLHVDGDIDVFGGFVTADTAFRADGNLDFMLSGGATVGIPSGWDVWFAGAALASANYMVSYTNDLNLGNDFVAAWGTLPGLASLGPIGVQVWLAPSGAHPLGWRIIGAKQVDALAQQQAATPTVAELSAGAVSMNVGSLGDVQPLNATPQSESFAIDPGTNWALFVAEWENASAGVTMSLQTPDGTFDEAAIAADPNMQIVAELSTDTRRVIRVDNPTSGTWTVTVDDTTGLGVVDLRAMVDATAPTVVISGLSGGLVGTPVQIDYESYDADSDATIAFYYDDDNTGYDGILIEDGLIEADGADSYSWDTTGVPEGDYYVYAVIIDDVNVPQFAYSDASVTITQPLASLESAHVFYAGSSFDDGSGMLSGSAAGVDTAKQPLRPDQTATMSHYTNYLHGLNGLMIDIDGLSDASGLDVGSLGNYLSFRAGNNDETSGWSAAPSPSRVAVFEGAGDNGSDRVVLAWDESESVKDGWLEVTVLANANTGLAEDDVFYFGNAIGETFNSPTNAFVDGSDLAGVRDNPRDFLNPAGLDNPYDINRDSFVDGTDFAIVRDNPTDFLSALKLITPGNGGAPLQSEPAEHAQHEEPATDLLAALPGPHVAARDADGGGGADPESELADLLASADEVNGVARR